MTDAVRRSSPTSAVSACGPWGPSKPEQAVEIEKLGYGAVWVGGSPAGDLELRRADSRDTPRRCRWPPASSTSGRPPAEQVAESYHRIEKAYPGRFLLGIGIGHPEHTEEYRKPYDVLVEYLDALDAAKVPTSRRVIAALGPKVLKLVGQAQRGCASVPDDARAHRPGPRTPIGKTVFLAPEHKVVLTTDAEQAREIGRDTVGFYLNLSNYLNNWKRLGFTDDDIAKPGSDKLIDAVVAHGTPEAIAARLTEHLDAGADHVTIQVLGGWDELLPTLTELAGPLGLNRVL